MRCTTASDADLNPTTLLDAVQREPVFIERDQQPVAVLVSTRDDKRLNGKAARDFNALCDQIAAEAAANGLTEEKLQEILDHA